MLKNITFSINYYYYLFIYLVIFCLFFITYYNYYLFNLCIYFLNFYGALLKTTLCDIGHLYKELYLLLITIIMIIITTITKFSNLIGS